VRKFIEAHGDARFEVAGADRVVPNQAGYRKGAGADQEWWCLPEVWKTDICAGLDPVGVAKALEGSGMLRRQGAKLQCNVRVGERIIRAYVVSASILEGLGDDE
jgi:putative DNA primase/helicase